MKDQLIAVLEAVRLARLELECYRDPLCRATAEWTLSKLDKMLNAPDFSEAFNLLYGETESPPLSPEHMPDRQTSQAATRKRPIEASANS
jgi:hypothetical protein